MASSRQMITDRTDESRRILFLPNTPHDGQTAREVFAEYDMQLCPVEGLAELIDEAEREAGCLLLVEEALDQPDADRLVSYLRKQPTWSDMPVIVITRPRGSSAEAWELTESANATLVERPLHIKTLVTIARSALRDRSRQYEIRRSIANRDRFLVMLGHELRNPLTAIMLAVEQLAGEDGEDEDNTAVDIIQRQSHKLESLINDLLEVSRISRGVLSFDKQLVDLVEIAREAADAFLHITAEQHLQFDVDLPDSPLWVCGDAVRLGQVVGNLLSNAVRYTPEGGWIRVNARRRDDTAMVTVRDSGIGIPPETMDNIFDVFSQAHEEVSRRKGGLGLGLGLARSIVDEHDGDLVAESPGEDQGSTFSMCLPIARAPEERARPGDSGSSPP